MPDSAPLVCFGRLHTCAFADSRLCVPRPCYSKYGGFHATSRLSDSMPSTAAMALLMKGLRAFEDVLVSAAIPKG